MQCSTSPLSKVHSLIHEADYALNTGDIEEVKRLHREIDLLTHEAIDKEPKVHPVIDNLLSAVRP